jgi:hypothetical protein
VFGRLGERDRDDAVRDGLGGDEGSCKGGGGREAEEGDESGKHGGHEQRQERAGGRERRREGEGEEKEKGRRRGGEGEEKGRRRRRERRRKKEAERNQTAGVEGKSQAGTLALYRPSKVHMRLECYVRSAEKRKSRARRRVIPSPLNLLKTRQLHRDRPGGQTWT